MSWLYSDYSFLYSWASGRILTLYCWSILRHSLLSLKKVAKHQVCETKECIEILCKVWALSQWAETHILWLKLFFCHSLRLSSVTSVLPERMWGHFRISIGRPIQTLSLRNGDSLCFNTSQKTRKCLLKSIYVWPCFPVLMVMDLYPFGAIIPNKPFLLLKERKHSLEAMLFKDRWQCLTAHFFYDIQKNLFIKMVKIIFRHNSILCWPNFL